jgi:hypothetical protein
VVCMNEEQSARGVARFGLEVPLTPRRQLLALHDPRSAMTLEKALLTVAKARTIVVLFMIVIPKSNSESDSMQNSQMELDLFELNDFRKEETVAAPLTERTPKLICSLDLTTSKQSMFGSYPRSGHTVLAYSTKNELVLRIKSIEIQLWPLIKLSSLISCCLRLFEAQHCKTTALQPPRNNSRRTKMLPCKGPAWKLPPLSNKRSMLAVLQGPTRFPFLLLPATYQ